MHRSYLIMGDEMAKARRASSTPISRTTVRCGPPVRLAVSFGWGFGVLTLLPVVSLVPQARTLLSLSEVPTHFTWWLAVALGLWVFPYVINISRLVALIGGRTMRVGPSQGGSRLPHAHSLRAS